jgi:hypothetical protein
MHLLLILGHRHRPLIPLNGVGTIYFLLPFSSITRHVHAHFFYFHVILHTVHPSFPRATSTRDLSLTDSRYFYLFISSQNAKVVDQSIVLFCSAFIAAWILCYVQRWCTHAALYIDSLLFYESNINWPFKIIKGIISSPNLTWSKPINLIFNKQSEIKGSLCR